MSSAVIDRLAQAVANLASRVRHLEAQEIQAANLPDHPHTAALGGAISTDQPITVSYTRPQIRLLTSGTAYARLAQFGPGEADFSQNLTWDGSNWNLDDASAAGADIAVTGGGILFMTFPAGANPRPLEYLGRWFDGGGLYVARAGTDTPADPGDGYISVFAITDRTPMPADLAEAYVAVESVQRTLDSEGKAQVDHAALHPSVQATDKAGEPMGRNLSALVSAQNEVIRDLLKRIAALEAAKPA